MIMITAYGLKPVVVDTLLRLTARTLLCCYGESIGITGLFSPRKVVEWRLGCSLLCNMT